MKNKKGNFYENYWKRILDIFLSTLAILILSPLFLIIMFLVLVKLGSPIIFKQNRPGKNGVIFKMYKFRSMTNEKNSNGQILSDELRITKFGSFLRSSSLDELPELFNILKGDMSFVGPRPLLVEYLSLYSQEQNKRHEVKPGLTGLAQINGRNSINWSEKFKLDVEYVNNVSFLLDIKIILLTFKKVILREGINSNDHVSSVPFTGKTNEENV